jgi:hypothetical protein
MLARRAVLLIPPRPPVPPQLPLYKTSLPLSPLESTLLRLSPSADSKRLTKNLNPLAATLTKKGEGGPPFRPQSLSTRYYARTHILATHVPPQPQSLHRLAHSFRHLRGWGGHTLQAKSVCQFVSFLALFPSTFNCRLSTSWFPLFFKGSLATRHCLSWWLHGSAAQRKVPAMGRWMRRLP